jgi:hypothetical protein
MITKWYSLWRVLDDAKVILQKTVRIIPDQSCVLVFTAFALVSFSVLPHPTPHSAVRRASTNPPAPRCRRGRRWLASPCCAAASLFLSRVVAAFFFLPRVVLFHLELKMGFSLPPTD